MQHPGAHQLLFQSLKGGLQFLFLFLELAAFHCELLDGGIADFGLAVLPSQLVSNLDSRGQIGFHLGFHRLKVVVLVVGEQRIFLGFLGSLGGHFGLGTAQFLNKRLGRVQRAGHNVLSWSLFALLNQIPGVLATAGFHHHDGHVFFGSSLVDDTTGNDHVERGLFHLGVGRERHPLPVNQGQAGAADGSRERQTSQLGRHRGGVNRHHVISVVGVD